MKVLALSRWTVVLDKALVVVLELGFVLVPE